jgi:hypothetical protein
VRRARKSCSRSPQKTWADESRPGPFDTNKLDAIAPDALTPAAAAALLREIAERLAENGTDQKRLD